MNEKILLISSIIFLILSIKVEAAYQNTTILHETFDGTTPGTTCGGTFASGVTCLYSGTLDWEGLASASCVNSPNSTSTNCWDGGEADAGELGELIWCNNTHLGDMTYVVFDESNAGLDSDEWMNISYNKTGQPSYTNLYGWGNKESAQTWYHIELNVTNEVSGVASVCFKVDIAPVGGGPADDGWMEDWKVIRSTEVVTDTDPPQWSQPNVNVSNPHRGEAVNISTVWEDVTSGSDWAWLSTNESGEWKNYTDDTHDSPTDLGDVTSLVTSNFSWLNQTGEPRVIGWIIYANDTILSNFPNGTNVPTGAYEGNFTMWGWSNATWASPDDGTATAGDIINLTCFVNDTNTTGSGPIEGHHVHFYNETITTSTYLGKNFTNSSGYALWVWNTTGLGGTFYPKCNITDNSTLYYNASEHYEANTTIYIGQGYPRYASQSLSFSSSSGRSGALVRTSINSFQFTSLIPKTSTLLRPFSGTFSMTSLTARISGIVRSLSQPFTFASSISVATAQIYERAANVYFTITGAFQRVASFSRALVQSLATSTLIDRIISLTKSLTQPVSVSTLTTRISSIGRGLSQTITMNTVFSRILSSSRALTQGFSISSLTTRVASFTKTLSQSFNLNTLTSRIASLSRVFTQSFNISSSISIATVQIYERIVSFYFTLTSSLSRLMSTGRFVSQAIDINSLAQRISSLSRALSQGFNLNTLTSRIASLSRVFTQSFNISSSISITTVQIYNRVANVYLTITGAFQRVASFSRALTQALTTSTLIDRISSLTRRISQGFNLNTLTSRIASLSRAFTQPFQILTAIQTATAKFQERFITQGLTITANIARILSIVRPLSQILNFNTLTARLLSLTRPITQGFTTLTATSRLASLSRTITQSFSVSTSISRLASLSKILSESLNLSSVTARVIALTKTSYQTFGITAITSRIASLSRAFTQSFNISSSISIATAQIYNRVASAYLTITGAFQRVASFSRAITQSLTTSTLIDRISSLTRALSQGFNLNTLTSRVASLSRAFSQSFNISSSISTVTAQIYNRVASVYFTITGAFQRVASFSRAITQSLTTSTLIDRISSLTRALSQTLNITAFYSRIIQITRAFTQTFNVGNVVTAISGTINERFAAVSFSIGQSIQRGLAAARVLSQGFNLNVITTRAISIFRSFTNAINFILRLLLPCSLFKTQPFCTATGCNWCDGICQAEACPAGEPPQQPPGGGGPGTPTPPEKISKFTIDKDFVKVLLKPGETKREIIVISNTGDTDLTITVNLRNLENFLVFPGGVSEYTFDLKVDEEKTTQLNFFASEEQEPGVFPGKVVVTGNGIEKLITVIVEIESIEPLFDIDVEIPNKYKEVSPGEDVMIQLMIYNVKRVGRVDVNVEYGIKDSEGNTVVSEYETLAVEMQVSVVRSLYIPYDTKPGNYIAFAIVRYDETAGTGSDILRVVTKEEIKMETVIIVSLLGTTFALIGIIVILSLYKRKHKIYVYRKNNIKIIKDMKKRMRKRRKKR